MVKYGICELSNVFSQKDQLTLYLLVLFSARNDEFLLPKVRLESSRHPKNHVYKTRKQPGANQFSHHRVKLSISLEQSIKKSRAKLLWCEALSSGRQNVKINTSTHIRSTQTLTALKLGKIKPDLVFDILALDFFQSKFLTICTASGGTRQFSCDLDVFWFYKRDFSNDVKFQGELLEAIILRSVPPRM